jgi:hypothetical protein
VNVLPSSSLNTVKMNTALYFKKKLNTFWAIGRGGGLSQKMDLINY